MEAAVNTGSMPQALAALAAGNMFRHAFAMAEELDQIRSNYGEDCLSFVKSALLHSSRSEWTEVVDEAISSWLQSNPESFRGMDI